MIIAIDGPAGAGKSTVAKRLADQLGFLYIDTGAMYRALTLKILDNKIDFENIERIIEVARNTKIELVTDKTSITKVILDDVDVSLAIRQPRVTQSVSLIAKIKEVRQIMVCLQRRIAEKQNCILDGRDIGTVVFPNAQKKFYIDASFSERVKRRYLDLINLGVKDVSYEQVAEDLRNRDTIDSTRDIAPLRRAPDAIYIDTTNLTIEEVVQKMLEEIKKQDG
ncbi:MAG: (d)CMP kinase [Candidatus Omnitrophica bacterium]|nr:(d)CMP kinase [Candidatus Omnitrophota bacterium]